MRPFLICLSPAILGFILVMYRIAVDTASDDLLFAAMWLFGIGAVIAGGCVARKVFCSIEDPVWWAWLGSILTFLGVGVGYFAMTMGGCCGLVMVGQPY